LYRFAYAEFTCGHYARAGALIGHCQELSVPDAAQAVEAHWGKLACDILLQRPDDALTDLLALKDRIEGKASTASAAHGSGASVALEKLHRRTWLAHYALYVCFGHAQGLLTFVDLCMEEKMSQAIQTVCPHLLRYVGAAVILTRRSRREFLRSVERNDDTTLGVSEMVRNAASCGDASDRDPVVVFLRRLFVDYDFEAARSELERCSQMIKADFFLAARHDEFMQNARVLIFESYCRVHQRIALPLLAQKLGMDVEAAERWLVNMIRDARLDAKIDAANNQIVLSPRVLSPHQRVIDKTKGLAFRSSVLLGNLERTRQHKEKSAQAAANDNDD
jgi:translation initiation factor 3 subunit E